MPRSGTKPGSDLPGSAKELRDLAARARRVPRALSTDYDRGRMLEFTRELEVMAAQADQSLRENQWLFERPLAPIEIGRARRGVVVRQQSKQSGQ